MNVDWSPLQKALAPLWKQIKTLFAEHHFITIICAFFAVLMVISFYKFLKNISPALVYFVLFLIFALQHPFAGDVAVSASPWREFIDTWTGRRL